MGWANEELRRCREDGVPETLVARVVARCKGGGVDSPALPESKGFFVNKTCHLGFWLLPSERNFSSCSTLGVVQRGCMDSCGTAPKEPFDGQSRRRTGFLGAQSFGGALRPL